MLPVVVLICDGKRGPGANYSQGKRPPRPIPLPHKPPPLPPTTHTPKVNLNKLTKNMADLLSIFCGPCSRQPRRFITYAWFTILVRALR